MGCDAMSEVHSFVVRWLGWFPTQDRALGGCFPPDKAVLTSSVLGSSPVTVSTSPSIGPWGEALLSLCSGQQSSEKQMLPGPSGMFYHGHGVETYAVLAFSLVYADLNSQG